VACRIAPAYFVTSYVEMICDPLPGGYRGEQTLHTGLKDLRAVTKIRCFGLCLFDHGFQIDYAAYQVPASAARGRCVRADRKRLGQSGRRLLRYPRHILGEPSSSAADTGQQDDDGDADYADADLGGPGGRRDKRVAGRVDDVAENHRGGESG
jgi:hypothetical protein